MSAWNDNTLKGQVVTLPFVAKVRVRVGFKGLIPFLPNAGVFVRYASKPEAEKWAGILNNGKDWLLGLLGDAQPSESELVTAIRKLTNAFVYEEA